MTAIEVGAALRARRIELALSQQELADAIGVTRQRVGLLESGRMGQARLLFEMAEALGLDLVALPRERAGVASIVQQQRALVAEAGKRVRR